MGVRAYFTGAIVALIIGLAGSSYWLWNVRANLLAERVELRRQVEIGAQLLEQAKAAQAIANAAMRDEAARRRAAEAQIRRILAGTTTGSDGNETAIDDGCTDDPISCALDWLREQQR